MAVDLTNAHDPSQTPEWRQRAVILAVERKLVGQAFYDQHATSAIETTKWLRCVSVDERSDHILMYDAATGSVFCDCQAGTYRRPCSHAGAAFLLITHLVPERVRDEYGRAQR